MKTLKKTIFSDIYKLSCLIILMLLLISSAKAQNIADQKRWIDDLNYMIERLEIMHPNLYANVSKDKFYKRIEEVRAKSSNLSDVEFILEFSELVAMVRDGHAKVSIESSNGDILRLFHIFPVRFYLFDDGLYVLSCDRQHSRIVGKKVLKIGTLSAGKIVERFNKIISADNHYGLIKEIQYSLNRPEILKYIGATNALDKITLLLEDDHNKSFEYEIESEPFSFRINHFVFPVPEKEIITMNENSSSPLPLYLSRPDNNYWYEYLPERHAIYVNIHYMKDKEEEDFKNFCDRIFKELDSLNIQRIIIDIRNNVGGTNFFESPLIHGIWQRPYLNNSERLFLIIGRTTFSAGQHMATQFTKYTNATLIGEPTSGKPNHFGSSRRFELPNSKLVIKTSIDYIQDAEPFEWDQATWPDIDVPVTSSDYRNNIDPVIMKVFNHYQLMNDYKEFKEKLQKAYLSDSMIGFINQYLLIKDSIYKKGIVRKLLMDDIKSWIWDNKISLNDYTEYLLFLEKEFPDSFEVYYSLGIRMMNSGKNKKATEYFNKCLKLQPTHRFAFHNVNNS